MQLPPEDEICLLLARAELSVEARERVLALLEGGLDWPRVFERARTFEIFPLFYDALRKLGFHGVPDLIRAEWTKTFNLNAIRNELLAKELARILQLLGDAQIPVMPIKGVALGESLYGDPALRPSADIDVLVHPRRAIEAFHLLASSGYQPELTHSRFLKLVVHFGKDCMLMTRRGSLCDYTLELHFGLVWGGPLELEMLGEIWSEAVPKTFFGASAFAMSAEWEFLYLAVHATRHGGPSLKWLVDLDRISRRGTIDWKKVDEKAKWLGWNGAVRFNLATCNSLFETPIDSALGMTASRVDSALRPADFPSVSEILFSLRLLKTPSRRLRYLAIHLFVPTLADYEFLPLPDSLFFLYYALRPLRVAAETSGWFIGAGVKRIRRVLRQAGRKAE